MFQAAATEVAKNFGEWHEKAMREPVIITKHGRESAVLMSAEAFHKLLIGRRELPVANPKPALPEGTANRGDDVLSRGIRLRSRSRRRRVLNDEK